MSVEPVPVKNPRFAVERFVVLTFEPDARLKVVVPVLAVFVLVMTPVPVV